MTKIDALLIMNSNGEEEVDLGLALGSTSYHSQSRSKSSSGAGVNANISSGDMAFAASDPLSELVWLPHKGLSLKCADSSSTGKKPFLLWNVECSSSKLLSPSQIIRSWGPEHDTLVKFPQTMLNVGDEVGDRVTSVIPLGSSPSPMAVANCAHDEETKGKMEEGGANPEEEHLMGNGEENCNPHIVGIVNVVQGSTETPEQDVLGSSDVNMDSVKMLDLIDMPPLSKLECTAENDLQDPPADDVCTSTDKRRPRSNSLTVERSPKNSRIQLYKEKGKGKAVSDSNGRSRGDEDDSHESAESCNSAGLFSKGVKRSKFDPKLIVESKRKKIESASTSIVNHNSSFMNWISNMVKGFQEFNKEAATPSLALTLARSDDFDHQESIKFDKSRDPENRNLGFQAMFQSLYRSTPKIGDTGLVKQNYSTGEFEERVVADETFVEECPRLDGEVNLPISRNLVGPPSCTMPQKSSARSSLWITRLSVKTPELENRNRSTDQVLECSMDCVMVDSNTQINAAPNCEASISNSNKSSNKGNPILPSPKFETSEAMASVFARRLDALRHVVPSDKTRSSTSTMCFFCGKTGHNLRECPCPEITETELDNLVQKTSLFDKVEGSSSLCLRCSQLDHWAVACPLASSTGHCQLKQSASFVNYRSHLMLCSSNENFSSFVRKKEDHSQMGFGKLCSDYTPSNLTWGVNEFLGKSTDIKKSILLNSQNEIKEDQKFPLYKVRGLQSEDAPVEMFNAIRKLRLSRVDILRCMNSPISHSQLNGFFLRLRLGKWTSRLSKEEIQPAELGKAGYYVACITGAQRENLGGSSKNSVFADVEGINYSVESQYVSNHDFSAEEIRGWWCRIVKGGGKIPSLDELNSKLEERKVLGF